jgi:hypothetical protein
MDSAIENQEIWNTNANLIISAVNFGYLGTGGDLFEAFKPL